MKIEYWFYVEGMIKIVCLFGDIIVVLKKEFVDMVSKNKLFEGIIVKLKMDLKEMYK